MSYMLNWDVLQREVVVDGPDHKFQLGTDGQATYQFVK